MNHIGNRSFNNHQPNLLDLTPGDVEKWKECMKKEMLKAKPKAGRNNTPDIYPVPPSWYEAKPSSYTPRVLRLGPLSPGLAQPCPNINRWKMMCVKSFMERHGVADVEELAQSLIPDPENAATIYSSAGVDDNQLQLLCLMLAVDTVVLHEFMRLIVPPWEQVPDDYPWGVFHNSITIDEVMRDLLLVGNQIPLSFLNNLVHKFPEAQQQQQADDEGSTADAGSSDDNVLAYDFIRDFLKLTTRYYDPFFRTTTINGSHKSEEPSAMGADAGKRPTLSDYLQPLLRWTRGVMPFLGKPKLLDHEIPPAGELDAPRDSPQEELPWPWEDLPDVDEHEHLLDYVYTTCTRKYDAESRHGKPKDPAAVSARQAHRIDLQKMSYTRLPSASRLKKAGIRFTAPRGFSNISVIRFDSGEKILYLPRLLVDNTTEDMLRNLLAYEKTSKECEEEEQDLVFYAMVMDSLIDTPKDAKLLVDAHVIDNALGSPEKLAHMWNELGVGSYAEGSPRWNEINVALHKHCNVPWYVWQVELHSTYFSRPWYWIPLAVASLLLICALLQTIYTIKGFYHSPGSV